MAFFKKAGATISPLAGMMGGEEGYNPLMMMSPLAHLLGKKGAKKALPYMISPLGGLLGVFK
jgi:hypothetical protein